MADKTLDHDYISMVDDLWCGVQIGSVRDQKHFRHWQTFETLFWIEKWSIKVCLLKQNLINIYYAVYRNGYGMSWGLRD